MAGTKPKCKLKYQLSKQLNFKMDSKYIQETVGPVISEGLSKIVLETTREQSASSYSSKQTPISQLANHLLQHERQAKHQKRVNTSLEAVKRAVSQAAEVEEAAREARNKFGVQMRLEAAKRLLVEEQQALVAQALQNKVLEAEALMAAENTVESATEADSQVAESTLETQVTENVTEDLEGSNEPVQVEDDATPAE